MVIRMLVEALDRRRQLGAAFPVAAKNGASRQAPSPRQRRINGLVSP
jgi:hypothetical protein